MRTNCLTWISYGVGILVLKSDTNSTNQEVPGLVPISFATFLSSTELKPKIKETEAK